MSDSESITRTKVCPQCKRELPLDCYGASLWGVRSSCRECEAERSRKYYAANREKVRARQNEYVRAHLLPGSTYNAERYKAYYHKHRDKINARHKRYNAANPEAIAKQKRKWKVEHKDSVVASRAKYRLKKLNNGGECRPIDIAAQYKRQKGKCYWCGTKVGDDYHVDHVVPLSKGGSNGPENIVISCPPCNRKKHNKHPMEWSGQLL